MKHIITTVGTSIFSNFFATEVITAYKDCPVKHENLLPKKDLEDLEPFKADDYSQDEFGELEKRLKEYWLIGTKKKSKKKWEKWAPNLLNKDASAEIKSICKIIEESEDTEFKIYLLCSDTAICMSAGHLVKAFFEGYEVNGKKFGKPDLRNRNSKSVKVTVSDYSPCQIDDLVIEDASLFIDKSIGYLLSRIDNVRRQKGVTVEDIILNISGGYKALIPVMTIYAQVRKVDICYIYENSEELIQITPFPISFEYELLTSTGIFLQSTLLKAINQARGNGNEFERLAQKLEKDKLIQITATKLKTTPLGGILSSLSTSEIQGDFGDKIIEDALKDFFNNSARSFYSEYLSASGKRRIDKPLSVSGCKDIHISETDIELERTSNTKVIGEIKAWSTNNKYIKSKGGCDDYFYKMKGRILLHEDFNSFKNQPIEFLYIVYAFQFNAHKTSLKNNPTVEHFKKRFAEDEDLQKLNVSFRALGLTIPIEDPLNFNYLEFKKDWTKYLYDSKNWEEL